MSFNQDNKGKTPEDQDNEQGGAPLVEPPNRPKSTLNPTTAAYLPGRTALQDLEATYQKATQGSRGDNNNGPVDLSTATEAIFHHPVPKAPLNVGGLDPSQSDQNSGGHQTLGNFMGDDPFVNKPDATSPSVLDQTRAMLRDYHKKLLATSAYGPPGRPTFTLPDNQHTKTPGLPMPTEWAYPSGYPWGENTGPPDANGNPTFTQEDSLNAAQIDFGRPDRPPCYFYIPGSLYYGLPPPRWDEDPHPPQRYQPKPAGRISPVRLAAAYPNVTPDEYIRLSMRPLAADTASQTPTRQVSETPKDTQGYTNPNLTTPTRALQRSKASTPGQPASAGKNKTAMVLHKPQKNSPAQVRDMKTRPKPEMLLKPNMNPQFLFFQGEMFTINLPPLPPAPVPPYIWAARSEMLKELTSGPTGYPTLAAALDRGNFPFEATSEEPYRVPHGVIRIKNIPFNTKRCEVIALFGKNGRILNDVDEPVHIIMDRVSSKTNDAYVEFVGKEDAFKAMERFTKQRINEKPPRLGDRTIVMELSDQAELMRDLFPRAKNVYWDDNLPKILPDRTDRIYGNFRGFVSEEEMIMLVKHVDTPHRAPFSKESPQRPFECIISTLKKLPWSCPEGITIRQRNAIFETASSLISRLKDSIRYGKDQTGNLNSQLLNRLVNAAMNCPGFTVSMKDDLVFMLKMSEKDALGFCLPSFAASWRHFYGLRPKRSVPIDLIEWYVAVIREETMRLRDVLPLATRNHIQSFTEEETDSYFGDFWVEVFRPAGAAFENETVANCIERELICIGRVLRRALGA